MAFSWPYETDTFIAYHDGKGRETRLSFALKLIDEVTQKEPFGHTRVKIDKLDPKVVKNKVVKNPSGFYVFTDLDEGIYTVLIKSDWYHQKKITIDTSTIKTDKISLNFITGPKSDATSVAVTDVSKLHIHDVIEFHNPFDEIESSPDDGELEIRDITGIAGNTISWSGGLHHNFNKSNSTIVVLGYLVLAILQRELNYPFC
ncbi:MAG: hypothetical protein KAS66_04315 [Candidatus Omnitrophica bacterium]|nr:hypothetical protein [Candidatus Omnitrophota bacterium]